MGWLDVVYPLRVPELFPLLRFIGRGECSARSRRPSPGYMQHSSFEYRVTLNSGDGRWHGYDPA
jgi:hypothetical protein